MIFTEEEADKKCREIALAVNDHLAGEHTGICAVGALIFSAVTAGRTAVTDKDTFLLLASNYYDEGAADRRRNLN